jgi:hypothetical protein
MSFRNLSRNLNILVEAKAPAKGKAISAPTDPAGLAKYISDLPKSKAVPIALLYGFKDNNKKIAITGLTFEDAGDDNGRVGISNVNFKDCKFLMKSGAANKENFSRSLSLNNCEFENCVFDGSSIGSFEVYSRNVRFSRCTFIDDGVNIVRQPEGDTHSVFIENSTFNGGYFVLHSASRVNGCTFIGTELMLSLGYLGDSANDRLRDNTFRDTDAVIFGDSWEDDGGDPPADMFDNIDVGTWKFQAEEVGDELAFYRKFDWKGTKGLNTAKGLPDGFLKDAKKRGIIPQQYSLVLAYDGYAKDVQVFDSQREAMAASKQFSCQLYVVVGNQQENEPVGETEDGDRGEADLLRDFRL